MPCDPVALVAAVATATASPGEDTVTLAPGCVYTFTRPAVEEGSDGLPTIRGKLTVHGNDATIRRAPDAPRFRLISNWGDLTLDRITLTGGHAPDGVGVDQSGQGRPGEGGGAIENWGPLTITDSVLTGNRAGAGAPGADATGTAVAGRGGLGRFGGAISSFVSGGGVESVSGAVVRITGSTITGNATADGAAGGSGFHGGDGGGGGVGAGIFLSTQEGKPLNPAITSSLVKGNRAGRGGDGGAAEPGGFVGRAGYGGGGGGIGVFYDTLTLDGGTKVVENAAGGPGAGFVPLPASGGGVYGLNARVVAVNGSYVLGNRPDNCDPVELVPGCRNPRTAPRARSAQDIVAGERAVEDLAIAVRAASAQSE